MSGQLGGSQGSMSVEDSVLVFAWAQAAAFAATVLSRIVNLASSGSMDLDYEKMLDRIPSCEYGQPGKHCNPHGRTS